MSSCDVFVLPSSEEAFGCVFAEAMAMRKPVVAARGQGTEDLITNWEDGVLVAPNTGDVWQALERLLGDSELADRIGDHAFEKVTSQFTWRESARKTGALYRSVLGRETRPET